MPTTKTLQVAYGLRMEKFLHRVLLENGPEELSQVMDVIAEHAERVAGLIDNSNDPRRTSPEEFVMDLWTENPLTLDKLNLVRDQIPPPKALTDLATVLDVLR
jgi:hypothetical protein